MRSVLFATTLLAIPTFVMAQSRCAMPVAADAPVQIPAPINVAGPPVSLVPKAPQQPGTPTSSTAYSSETNPSPSSNPAASQRLVLSQLSTSSLQATPALAHMAVAGATLSDLGTFHGLRTVFARNGDQYEIFEVAPDSQATVAGLMTELTPDQLHAMAGKDITELAPQHGLRTLFLRNGPHFQVFYVTPDAERIIPGVMWDDAGKNVTKEQIAAIPGTVPTVTIGRVDEHAPLTHAVDVASSGTPSLMAVAENTTHGSIGDDRAPQLWMFVDPQCSFSVRAMQQVAPYVAQGRIRLNVIPLSILDREDNGLSTRSALNLVSVPADQMVGDWTSGRMNGGLSADAGSKLQGNMMAAAALQLRGTPLFIWRKADGTDGRMDGVPNNMDAMIASVGG